MYVGRRGRKRKAETPVEEEVVEKRSAEPAAEEAEEAVGGQDGHKVVIEHWYASRSSS